MALLRLRSNKIIGRNIDKIQIAGKTNIVCFDKTGTLTNLGMNVKGIWKAHEP
jgi:cation-transporting ATPase 13A3/4/5